MGDSKLTESVRGSTEQVNHTSNVKATEWTGPAEHVRSMQTEGALLSPTDRDGQEAWLSALSHLCVIIYLLWWGLYPYWDALGFSVDYTVKTALRKSSMSPDLFCCIKVFRSVLLAWSFWIHVTQFGTSSWTDRQPAFCDACDSQGSGFSFGISYVGFILILSREGLRLFPKWHPIPYIVH